MKRRAFVFIITLATLVALVGAVSFAASSAESSFKARRNRMEKREADLAIQAAIQNAMATLANVGTTTTGSETLGTTSTTPGGGAAGTATDTDETQDWYTLGTTGADVFHIGNITFREQILDACSLVNLNTAPEAQLLQLPLTQQQIDSLLDWISAGETPRPEGAKDSFYNSLTNPYNAHLMPLTSLDELLQVQGFTPATLFQPQQTVSGNVITNDDGTQATLYDLCTVDSQSKSSGTNINTATLQQLVRSGVSQQNAARLTGQTTPPTRRTNFTTMGAVLRDLTGAASIRDATVILNNYQVGTTPTQTGLININTAPDTVLNTLPGMTTGIAQGIVGMQQSGITSLGSVTSISGVTLPVLAQFVDSITVNSTRYIVRIEATAGSTTESAEAIVDTSGTNPLLIRTATPPYSDMTSQWNWNAAANDIALDSSSGTTNPTGSSTSGGQN